VRSILYFRGENITICNSLPPSRKDDLQRYLSYIPHWNDEQVKRKHSFSITRMGQMLQASFGNVFRCTTSGVTHVCDQNCDARVQVDPYTAVCCSSISSCSENLQIVVRDVIHFVCTRLYLPRALKFREYL